MNGRTAALLALVSLAPALRPLAAQIGSTTDVLTGVVKDTTGRPVAEAIVEAMSIETGIMRTTKTDPRGRYTLLFPDGGGQYRVIVRSIGKTPIMRTVARQADEDRLVTNFTMGAPVTRLDEIVGRGRQGPPTGGGRPRGPGPGARADGPRGARRSGCSTRTRWRGSPSTPATSRSWPAWLPAWSRSPEPIPPPPASPSRGSGPPATASPWTASPTAGPACRRARCGIPGSSPTATTWRGASSAAGRSRPPR